jgi:E3 ubiquitin-protein ligase BRE1
MQEYKREKNTLESRLNDLIKRTKDHDDHLRAIDGWFKQVSPSLPHSSCMNSETDYNSSLTKFES